MAERTRKTNTENTREAKMKRKPGEQKESYTLNKGDWTVIRAHQFDNGNISFDLKIKEICFYRLIVVAAKDGHEFISFPQYQSNGKWYNHFYIPFTNEDQDAIIDAVYDSLDD